MRKGKKIMIQSILRKNMKTGIINNKTYSSKDLLQIKDFMLVQRVIKKINSILDLKDLLNQIIEDASITLGFTKCGVLLYDETADEMELVATAGWDENTYKAGDKFSRGKGIIWRAFDQNRMIYYPDINEYPEDIPCVFTSRSHIDIPLTSKGSVIGILNAQHVKKDGFTRHDQRLLKTLAAHVSVAIQNAKLFEAEKREKELILLDLKEASEIQSKMFPKQSPQINGFNIKGLCKPCKEVGGDWYDYIELPDGKIGVVLADVAGKGLGAAFLMSSARTIFKMVAMNENSPAEVLRKFNDLMVSDLPSSKFITLLYLILDPVTRKISVANAGHPYPVIINDGNVNYLVMDAGLPIGIKNWLYKDHFVSLSKDSKLFIYSDGVPEAMNSKKELFDNERLTSSLRTTNPDIETLYNSVQSFLEDTPCSDDLTIVMIEAK